MMASEASPKTFLTMVQQGNDAAPAIITPEALPLTYGDLKGQVRYARKRLTEYGIKKGDRIGIAAFGAQMAAGITSVAASSAVAVPFNATSQPGEIERHLTTFQPRVLIAPDSPETHNARTAAEKLGIPILTMLPVPGAAPGRFTLEAASEIKVQSTGEPLGLPDSHDIAVLLPTSGTTSTPKIVPLSHANFAAAAEHLTEKIGLSGQDRMLQYLPFSHAFGLTCNLVTPLHNGGSVVIGGDFEGGKKAADQVVRHKVTVLFAIPPMIRAVSACANRENAYKSKLGNLRHVALAGSPLTGEIVDKLHTAMPDTSITTILGLTETLVAASHRLASGDIAGHRSSSSTLGLIAPWPLSENIKLLDPESGKEMPANSVQAGTPAEFAVKSPQVTKGYLPVVQSDNPNASAFTHDGYFRTGDLVSLQDGKLYHVGRSKEMIKVNAQQVAPAEVENVIASVPPVTRAVAFGIPHTKKGQAVGAVVEMPVNELQKLAESVEGRSAFLAGLNRACEGLSLHKRPACYVVTDQLPTSGAIQKLNRNAMAKSLGITEQDHGILIHSERVSPPAVLSSVEAGNVSLPKTVYK